MGSSFWIKSAECRNSAAKEKVPFMWGSQFLWQNLRRPGISIYMLIFWSNGFITKPVCIGLMASGTQVNAAALGSADLHKGRPSRGLKLVALSADFTSRPDLFG